MKTSEIAMLNHGESNFLFFHLRWVFGVVFLNLLSTFEEYIVINHYFMSSRNLPAATGITIMLIYLLILLPAPRLYPP